MSFGIKGARVGFGSRGVSTTLSVPGTGLSWRSTTGGRRRRSTSPGLVGGLLAAALYLVFLPILMLIFLGRAALILGWAIIRDCSGLCFLLAKWLSRSAFSISQFLAGRAVPAWVELRLLPRFPVADRSSYREGAMVRTHAEPSPASVIHSCTCPDPTYKKLPDWGQPIVWGVAIAIPLVFVLFVVIPSDRHCLERDELKTGGLHQRTGESGDIKGR